MRETPGPHIQTAISASRPGVRLAAARLCVLIDARPDAGAFERLFAGLLAAGVPMFQIRDKAASDEVILDRGRRALALARRADPSTPALITINDRVAVAAAAGVDGVHVGATDMPVSEARRLLGSDRVIGRTAHDLDEARGAVAAGADYLGVGPCYPSSTKTFARQASRDFLRAASAEIHLPIFAIGGIGAGQLEELVSLGIGRVAVSAAVTTAASPGQAARMILGRLAGGGERTPPP